MRSTSRTLKWKWWALAMISCSATSGAVPWLTRYSLNVGKMPTKLLARDALYVWKQLLACGISCPDYIQVNSLFLVCACCHDRTCNSPRFKQSGKYSRRNAPTSARWTCWAPLKRQEAIRGRRSANRIWYVADPTFTDRYPARLCVCVCVCVCVRALCLTFAPWRLLFACHPTCTQDKFGPPQYWPVLEGCIHPGVMPVYTSGAMIIMEAFYARYWSSELGCWLRLTSHMCRYCVCVIVPLFVPSTSFACFFIGWYFVLWSAVGSDKIFFLQRRVQSHVVYLYLLLVPFMCWASSSYKNNNTILFSPTESK